MARLAYRFRLYPNKLQTEALQRSLDLCRDLYNGAVQERRDAWRLNRISIAFIDQSRQVPEIRRICPEYQLIQSRVCYQVLRRVDKTFKAFYRRIKAGEKAGYPRFKGKAFFNSFDYNLEGFRLFGTKLRLANIGLVKMKRHREALGTLKQVTIKREGIKWFAILSCDNVPVETLPQSAKPIGIDVGIESYATFSNGVHVENPRHYVTSQAVLRRASRRVARRKLGSSGRRNAVAVLRAAHDKIFRQRSDFQHKLSANVVREYGVIAIEKLNITGLSKSALAKQINDVAWGSFFDKLKYKAANAGRRLIEVNPRGTSQTCTCGAENRKNLKARWHSCFDCGLSLHRDVVSAQVILTRAVGPTVQALTYPVAESVV